MAEKHATYSLIDLAADEDERLAALLRLEVLDTPAEPEFDELVQLAAAICGTPVGLITLLDDRRQWFKASFGVQIRETRREVAFCNLTIVQRDVLIVPDTVYHDRLATNPDVTGAPHYRFYAGQTILSPEGYALGSLCVLDYVPRDLSEAQIHALRVLGQQVNARLELRSKRLCLTQTVTELQRSQQALEDANGRLRAMTRTDPLTGAANRRALEERLAADLQQSQRKGHALSVLLLDIDNFKQRNDRFGHEEGDACLKQLAALLMRTARSNDLVVRFGGEEFVVLLPETDEAAAMKFGERLLEAVHAENWRCQPATVSIGVASVTEATTGPGHLLQCADEAMYAAKRSGKDRVVGFANRLAQTVAA